MKITKQKFKSLKPIQKHKYGNYYLVDFVSDGGTPALLERHMKLRLGDIIRFITVKLEDDIEDKPQKFKSSKSSGEASLQDILDSGILPDDVKSISGAKSFEGKAKRNLAYRSIFGAAAVEKAMRYALDIWVGALKADGGITDEQAKGFLQNSKGATQTTAFKSFFEMGFMAPALKPMRLARDKQVKKDMSNADVPPQLENMIFSQTVGLSPQNPGKIRLKLNREFPDMKMEEMDETTKKLSSFVKDNAKKFQQDYFKPYFFSQLIDN